MRVKDLPTFKRPREKLIEKGSQALKDYELLAILLRTGYEGKSALEVAKRILTHHALEKLFSLPIDQLKKLKGVGVSRAAIISAGFELSKRIGEENSPRAIASISDTLHTVQEIRTKHREHLVALYLNARNHLIEKQTISIGSVTEGIVHPREVFSPAIKLNAVHMILSHNHPSGDPSPSIDDIAITKRLVQAGKLLGIELLDHVIVSKEHHYSFREKELL
ncbi:MAG: DNA repair protein RadC [Candidatus Roizmanbacteria bacterium]|nr:DNA repair protein RadC [Candidatus Roizmanbacteria bacterium]